MALLPGVLLAAVVWAVLRAHLWRAVLFIAPGSARVESLARTEAPTSLPPELLGAGRELLALNFHFLGAHLERPLFHRGFLSQDFADGKGLFATLQPAPRRGGAPRLYLLSEAPGAVLVLTAGHWRPSARDPRYQAACLPLSPLPSLVAFHRRRVKAPCTGGDAQAERLRLARAFYGPAGAAELRRSHAIGLIWVVAALGVVGLALIPRG